MTAITEVQSASACLFAGMWRPLVSVITTLYYDCDYFSLLSMVLRAFSACIGQNRSSGIILIP